MSDRTWLDSYSAGCNGHSDGTYYGAWGALKHQNAAFMAGLDHSYQACTPYTEPTPQGGDWAIPYQPPCELPPRTTPVPGSSTRPSSQAPGYRLCQIVSAIVIFGLAWSYALSWPDLHGWPAFGLAVGAAWMWAKVFRLVLIVSIGLFATVFYGAVLLEILKIM